MPPPQLPPGSGRGRPQPARQPSPQGARRFLPWLFWAGVGLAPIAAILLVLGNQVGPLRAAAVVAVLSAVAIGLSVVLRDDAAMVKDDVEEQLRTEVDRLRGDLDSLRRGVEVSVHRELERVRGELEVARQDTVLRAESTRITRLTGQLPAAGSEYDEYESHSEQYSGQFEGHYEDHYESHYRGSGRPPERDPNPRAAAYRPTGYQRDSGPIDADYQTVDPLPAEYRADRGPDRHGRVDEVLAPEDPGVVVGRQESIRYESATYGSVRAKATVYEAVEYSAVEPAAADPLGPAEGSGWGGGRRFERHPSGSDYGDPADEGHPSGRRGGRRRAAEDDSGDVYGASGAVIPGGRRARRRAAEEAAESGDVGGFGPSGSFEQPGSGPSYELVGYRSEPPADRSDRNAGYGSPEVPAQGGRGGRGDRFADLELTDLEPVEAYTGHAPGFDPLTSALDGWDEPRPALPSGRHGASGDVPNTGYRSADAYRGGGGYQDPDGYRTDRGGNAAPGSRYDRNGHLVISGDVLGASYGEQPAGSHYGGTQHPADSGRRGYREDGDRRRWQ